MYSARTEERAGAAMPRPASFQTLTFSFSLAGGSEVLLAAAL